MLRASAGAQEYCDHAWGPWPLVLAVSPSGKGAQAVVPLVVSRRSQSLRQITKDRIRRSVVRLALFNQCD